MAAEIGDKSGLDLDPLEASREGDLRSVRKFLESGGNINVCTKRTGRTMLHIACRQGNTEMVIILLSCGADTAAVTLRQLCPLHLAAHEGHLDISRLLLEAWAPVDSRDMAGSTPLHMAAQKGHTDVVRLLLQCGSDRDGANQDGWTALHFAAWKGYASIARTLLQAGANTKACDMHHSTPLHVACSFAAQPEIVEILLQFGADPCAKDASGSLPDDYIGADCPQSVEPSVARVLSRMLVEHRARNRRHHATSSSLGCVVTSLRAKVSELEDQLTRAMRRRLELEAHSSDSGIRTFSAAIRPECSICQAETKEAVLEPCRHLATCASCADSLKTCPFCTFPVRRYDVIESREVIGRMRALEDEVLSLRAQLEPFRYKVDESVTANGESSLTVRRSKVKTTPVFAEEHQVSGEQSVLLIPPSFSPRDLAADSDCGSNMGESYVPCRMLLPGNMATNNHE